MNRNTFISKIDDFNDCMINDEKSKRTIKKYNHAYDVFLEIIKSEEINKHQIIDFKNKIIEMNLKPSTTNSYIQAINKLLRFSGCAEMCVKKIKVQHSATITDVVTVSDYKRLKRMASRMGYEDTAMCIEVLAKTGIRFEELKYFTNEAVNSKEYVINVYNKGKNREIFLRKDLRRSLRKYCKTQHIDKYLFYGPNDKSKPILYVTLNKRLKAIAGQARIKKEKVHPHAFRHLFAINYLENGGNLANLADILGHSDLRTTQVYTRMTKDQTRKKLEGMKW